MLQLCDQNIADNTGMFWLLLNKAKDFPLLIPPERRLGVHKEGRGHNWDK